MEIRAYFVRHRVRPFLGFAASALAHAPVFPCSFGSFRVGTVRLRTVFLLSRSSKFTSQAIIVGRLSSDLSCDIFVLSVHAPLPAALSAPLPLQLTIVRLPPLEPIALLLWASLPLPSFESTQ